MADLSVEGVEKLENLLRPVMVSAIRLAASSAKRRGATTISYEDAVEALTSLVRDGLGQQYEVGTINAKWTQAVQDFLEKQMHALRMAVRKQAIARAIAGASQGHRWVVADADHVQSAWNVIGKDSSVLWSTLIPRQPSTT